MINAVFHGELILNFFKTFNKIFDLNLFNENESDQKPLLKKEHELDSSSNFCKCLITILIIIGFLIILYFLLIRTGILQEAILYVHHNLGCLLYTSPSPRD